MRLLRITDNFAGVPRRRLNERTAQRFRDRSGYRNCSHPGTESYRNAYNVTSKVTDLEVKPLRS